MDRPRALVIGGSLGGLFAANLLRTIGWNAIVFERAGGGLAGRGAGLGTRSELFEVMRRIVDFDESIGVEVRSRIALDRSGTTICEVSLQTIVTAWDRMYRALKAAMPPDSYRSAMQLQRFEQDGRKVTAFFADRSCVEGDLLVGADGIHSTVRRQLMPELKPHYAGYVSWRGVAEEQVSSNSFHPMLSHHMAFCFPEGELALSNPMPAPDGYARPFRRRCHFSWFRPADYETTLARMCTDAAGRRHGDSIPPPLIRPALIGEMRAEADALLAPQIAALVAQAGEPILQAIFDLESPRIAFGRAVLLGDAAFVARPHVGTGVTKAALDAQCLADALVAAGNDVDAALARYDGERRRFGRWLVARGRHLGRYLEAQLKPHRERAVAEHERHPEIVMREFGGAGVIDGHPNDQWSA